MFGRSRYGQSVWRSIRRRVAGGCLLLGMGACAATPERVSPAIDYDPALLSGERLFGAPLDPAAVPEISVIAVDSEMRAYVAELIGAARSPAKRLRALINGLVEDGYFATRSDTERTLTAAEAFRSRSGDCLSYTSLFVALAREAGLDASYQVVDVPPTWGADAGFLIRYAHVNVLVRGVRFEQEAGEVTVDFNAVRPDPEYPRRVVSDRYGAALHYANRAVDLLRAGRAREAFALLRRAIELAPENANLWVNLGALYATHGDLASAIEAYGVAERIEPANRSALAALARSHSKAGNPALAVAYEDKARHYLDGNPWYHLALAQSAYRAGDHAGALRAIDRALELEGRSGRMHFVKGLIEERLGNPEEARMAFRLARRYGVTDARKLDYLDRASRMGAF